MSDLLVVVLIANAAQNGMACEHRSIREGVVLILTIVGWDTLPDWLSYKYSSSHWLLSPPPLMLIKNGWLSRRTMRKELITQDELMSHQRRASFRGIDEVRLCHMEGSGNISVIKREGSPRFQIGPDEDGNGDVDGNVFVYIGDPPNCTAEPGGWTLAGNLINSTDLRYDTSQIGRTFYDTHENAAD